MKMKGYEVHKFVSADFVNRFASTSQNPSLEIYAVDNNNRAVILTQSVNILIIDYWLIQGCSTFN